MDLSHWLWLATAAYAVHMIEEFMLDWRDWARAVIKLPVEWPDFYIANGVVVALGICAANLAPVAPGIALGFAGLMLVNAILFHIAPFIWTRGRFSPGLFTAILLLIPVGAGCYLAAHDAGLLTTERLIGSLLLGAALMASPIVLLHIKGLPYFRQA
jgi:hypothetical protein